MSQLPFERLRTIYDAAFAKDQWTEALDAMQRGTQTAGVMLYDVGEQREIAYRTHAISPSYSWVAEHLPQYNAMMENPERNTGLDLEGSTFMHRQPAFRSVIDEEIWRLDKAFRARPEIRYTSEKMGFFRRFFINLSEDPLSYSGLLAHYPSAMEQRPPLSDRTQMELLSPHIAKAVELHRTLHNLRSKYNAVLSVLDHIQVAICLLDGAGHILARNRKASEMFDERDAVWVGRDGKIRGRSSEETALLSRACREIALTANGENNRKSVDVELLRSSENAPLVAVFSPLRDADMELDPDLSGALLTIIDGVNLIEPRLDLILRAYGLTPAETRVLPMILHGLSNAECAERMGIGPETVKSQVASILAKTQCRNRVALVWRIFTFSPPIT